MKKVKYLLLFFLAFLIGILISAYESGIPVEKLQAKYMYPESQFINIDGMDVHIRKTGSGVPLILLHGVASSLHTWEGWQDRLSDKFTVISIDVPAFGFTGGFPDGIYTIDRYMTFFDDLLGKLKIDSCYIAGNSFGGYLTWNYALHNPEKVKKIILIDAGGYPKKIWENDFGFFLSKYKATAWFTHIFTPKLLVRNSVKNAYKKDDRISEEIFQRYYELLVLDKNRQNFTKVLRMIPQEEANNEKLNKIKQPTLIMWGDDDQIIPFRNANKFKNDIKGSELIIYSSGHIPMEEDPEETFEDARNFLLGISDIKN